MRLHDAPAFRQPDPNLALPAVNLSSSRGALEFHRNGCKIAPERRNIEPFDGAGQVGCGPRFPECLKLIGAIEILGDAKAHD